MEPRGQNKDIVMPSSMGYNPPQPNQESSSRLLAAPTISSLRRNETGHGRINLHPSQTLDQHHQLNQSPPPHRAGRDPNPNQDPAQAQVAGATIASASISKTMPPPSSPPQSQLQNLTNPTTSANNGAISIRRYRECLRNHAANLGGHVFDGCGEFMPNGEEGTLEALKCAACDCHRNFHRKEFHGESQAAANCHYTYNHSINNSQRAAIHSTTAPHFASAPLTQQYYNYSHGYSNPSKKGPMMMSFGGSGGAAAESSSEDLNMFQANAGAQPTAQPSYPASKKRFRTKFTQEQKNRMQELAEKLGWRIQKQDEQEVQKLYDEVSIKRQVFKVWMHNNKQAMKKNQP